VVKPELGVKRTCPSCGARFYDLMKSPAECPKCGNAFDPEVLLKPRRARPEERKVAAVPVVAAEPEVEEAEEVEDGEEAEEEELEEAEVEVAPELADEEEEEEVAGAVKGEKPHVQDGLTEVEEDEEIEDDDDDVEIAEIEDEDEDVSDILDTDLDKEER
jgi:uncharacterized protein (TIGR02300 family)